MKRGKELIIVSHCILNQNSVVEPLARARGAFPISKYIIDSGVGIIALKCPEFKFLGPLRDGMTKEEYDCYEYRKICRETAEELIEDIKKYAIAGYKLKGIIGINESPTCSISGNRGILMEEIFNIFEENKIKLNWMEISTDYEELKEDNNIIENLKKILEK